MNSLNLLMLGFGAALYLLGCLGLILVGVTATKNNIGVSWQAIWLCMFVLNTAATIMILSTTASVNLMLFSEWFMIAAVWCVAFLIHSMTIIVPLHLLGQVMTKQRDQ